MRILVTNDDGHDAAGLATLRKVAASFGEVLVVAPKENNSYIGHRVTVRREMALEQVEDDFWVLDGTPADCVRVALKALGKEIDLVVSGINHGGNMGADVYASGTVAAAREAFFLGVPSIAFSQFRRSHLDNVEWDVSQQRAERALAHVLEKRSGVSYWNVNLPWPTPFSQSVDMRECEIDNQAVLVDFAWCDEKKHVSFQGSYQNRPREQGKEIASCIDEHIVTVVKLG